jgi:hypothetical protein
MRAGQEVAATVVGVDEAGNRTEVATSWSVEALPAAWPDVDVLVHERDRVSPGVTLWAPRAVNGPSWLVVLDAELEPIWWLDVATVNGMTVLDDSVLTVGEQVVIEYDWLGQELGRWAPSGGSDPGATLVDVPGAAFHHDIGFWGDRIVALSQETIGAEGFHVSYTDPDLTASVDVINDLWVAFDRNGMGEVLWRATDALDLGRIGYGSLTTQPDGALDWNHVNAASRLPDDSGWLMSSRHQNAVFAVDDETGALRWLVAPPDGWAPEYAAARLNADPGMSWTYQQHAPEVDASGTSLLVLDNHGVGVSAWSGEEPVPDALSVSRAVQFAIDPASGTVETTWELTETGSGALFAPVMGDVDRLENGNILVLFSGATYTDGQGNELLGHDARRVHLVEVDAASGAIVSELVLSTPLGTAPSGWVCNRVERLLEEPWN